MDQIIITGTAVFRDADNSEAVIEEIRKKLDLEIQIISGEEEGFLTSLGVLSSSNIKDNFFIVDIGGRSTELIYDINNRTQVNSLDIGVVSLRERSLTENPLDQSEILKANEIINQSLNVQISSDKAYMIGVAGTFTSIASIFLGQKKYDEEEIHMITLSSDWVSDFSSRLNKM